MNKTVRWAGLAAGAMLLLSVAVPVAAGGANTTGPYDATASGPSGNGNGNGHAWGRPMAGSVGKADNKNPPGQLPNALEDGDDGYECDANMGVALGNPAHSLCGVVPPPGGQFPPPS